MTQMNSLKFGKDHLCIFELQKIMNSSFWFDTINLEYSIVLLIASGVQFLIKKKNCILLSEDLFYL